MAPINWDIREISEMSRCEQKYGTLPDTKRFLIYCRDRRMVTGKEETDVAMKTKKLWTVFDEYTKGKVARK